MTHETSGQEPNMRAAEYVLGTLSAIESAQLERELEHDRELQLEVAYWEEQLGQLGLQLEPVEPPAKVWDAIRTRTREVAEPAHPAAPRPEPRRASRLWQSLAVAASIAVVVLAGLLYVATSRPPQAPQPTYASMFYDKPTATGWLVTANADSGEMSVMTLGAYPLPEDKELRLWIIPKGGKPIASGLVPPHGHNEWQMSARIAQLLKTSTATFAVSMEDTGTPVDNGPQGPIMWHAPVGRRTG